jgi:hypothetical protein
MTSAAAAQQPAGQPAQQGERGAAMQPAQPSHGHQGPHPMMGGPMHDPMRHGMMGQGMGMACPMMGMGMMGAGMMGGGDPKSMGRMLQLRGEMLRAMGEVLVKHGKAMEEGK